MTTFALVHGGWHDARCWTSLTPFLRAQGHGVVTMDLPCDDPTADFDTYADVVCGAVEDLDDVVVVGHSLGGLTIPLVAAQRPVRHLVYLCALIPDIGRNWFDQLAAEPDMMCRGWDAGLSVPDAQGRTTWTDPDLTRALLYADCDDAISTTATARLRPQVGLGAIPFPLTEFPSVPSTSVYCTDDRMLASGWAAGAARDRFGADVVELPGGHSPFLSRPHALAELLVNVAVNGSSSR
jgi:pimeloyl-ACP methyl ester carboxylesterase